MKFWTFERQLVAGFTAVGLALVAVLTVSLRDTTQLRATSKLVLHTQEVISDLNSLQSAIIDTETGVRGFLITGRKSFLDPYYASREVIDKHLQNLKLLTADNPAQEKRLIDLEQKVTEQLRYQESLVQTSEALGISAGRKTVSIGTGKQNMDEIREAILGIRHEEERLLNIRAAISEQSSRKANLILSVLRALMILVLFGAFLITWREVKLRRKAEQDLKDINNDLELRIQSRTAALEEAGLALRESEVRLQTTLENLSEGVAVASLEGNLLHFNKAALALHGFTTLAESQLALQDFTELIELSTLTGEVIPLEQWPLSRILRGETLHNLEIAVRHLGAGWIRTFSYNGSLASDKEGKPFLAVVTMTDITNRKKSEHKIFTQLGHLNLLDQITRLIGNRLDLGSIFQLVIGTLEESLPVDFGCIALYEAASKTLIISRIGSKSKELAVALGLTEKIRFGVDDNGLGRCTQGELVYEQDVSHAPFPFTNLLESVGLHSLVLAPLRQESQVFGVLIVARRKASAFSSSECEFLRQLSEHVALAAWHAQLHSALTQAYDDLRQTQQIIMQEERLRALGQMASGIAHDINNALSPVSLYAESLLENEKNLSPRARNYLETIHRAVDDVAQTVARMREFYRQRETQMELAPVNINRLVGQVLDLTRPRWQDMPQEHGIVIREKTDLQPELPPIMGAESEIRDALTNLILNAADAMPDGGQLTIRTRLLSAEATSQSGDRVAIEITDTGAGMDETTRQRCLEPFFTTKGDRGTGLGLAMVFGMTKRHSADLQIESVLGQGTTMRLLFAVPSNVIMDKTMEMQSLDDLPRIQILVIDDDPILLKSLTDTLETDGHVIVAADGGEKGILAFQSFLKQGKPFGLVITDLGMPYVDGHKVAAEIKRHSLNTPVILLTGWGQQLIDKGGVLPNVDRVLAKPPKIKEIREAIATFFLH